jgi:hypothetical protein
VNRRSLLAAGTTALAGCTAPFPPTTDGYPSTPPNFIGIFDWLPDKSGECVHFDAANVINADDTARIAIIAGEPTTARPCAGDDDPATPFPLESGPQLALTEVSDDVSVVWTAFDESQSTALARWPLDNQPGGGL